MDPFISYLLYVKNFSVNSISNDILSELHIIMGNESCDLDSMISALALGYLRYQHNPCAIPIMNIHSDEFATHTENCYILKKLGIDPDLLMFRNNFDLNLYQEKNLLKLSLVDHHILNEKDQHLSSSVMEIYDHRPVDPNINWGKHVATKIKRVGSCATLITDEIFQYCDAKTNIISKSLAWLLYSVITFDTIAFSVEAGKTTPLDEIIAARLVNNFNLDRDAQSVFNELWKAHNDVSHLTPDQLLHKDLKIVQGVPIPGLPMLVEHFFQIPNVGYAIFDFCTSKKCKVVIIMGLHVIDSDVQRDMAVVICCGGEALANAIIKSLEDSIELGLSRSVVDLPQVVYFKQGNIKLSRKYVLPIIKKVLDSYS